MENIYIRQRKQKSTFAIRGDGTNSFPIDLNTNILENATPFLRIAATLVYRSFELVNSKFKQAKKNSMLGCILDSRVNSSSAELLFLENNCQKFKDFKIAKEKYWWTLNNISL